MMHVMLKRQIGKSSYHFTFMGESLFEVLLESQHLGFHDVFKCGLCESDLLTLRAYVAGKEQYEYVKIVCGKCRASLTLGKRKDDGAFFLRRNEDKTLAWQAYTPKEGGEEA